MHADSAHFYYSIIITLQPRYNAHSGSQAK